MDVESTFLNGAHEEVYIEQPQGTEVKGKEDRDLKSRKTISPS